MNNTSCYVIRDLLPLYVDDVCSLHSKIMIEAHLKECEECRKYLDALRSELPPITSNTEALKIRESETRFFKKVKRKLTFDHLLLFITVLCVLIGVAVMFYLWTDSLTLPGEISADYKGPILPLDIVSDTDGIVAERTVALDFSDYDYTTDPTRTVDVFDQYTLTNTTDKDMVIGISYGFPATYATKASMVPMMKLDSEALDTTLITGRTPLLYERTSEGSVLETREDFVLLLEDGVYQKETFDALAINPVFPETAKVYKFEDVGADIEPDGSNSPYAKLLLEFDSEKTKIYTFGIRSLDDKNGEYSLGFTVPLKGSLDYGKEVYVVAVGEEPKIKDVMYYKNSLAKKTTDEFELELVEYDTTLEEFFTEIVTHYRNDFDPSSGTKSIYDTLTAEQLLDAGKQSILDLREEEVVIKLEGHLFGSYEYSQIFYQTAAITIPANSSVTVTLEYDKYTGVKKIDKKDYDYDGLEIATALGSDLELESQTLKITGVDELTISEYTTGEELENGQREIKLQDDYFEFYLEVPENESNSRYLFNIYKWHLL